MMKDRKAPHASRASILVAVLVSLMAAAGTGCKPEQKTGIADSTTSPHGNTAAASSDAPKSSAGGALLPGDPLHPGGAASLAAAMLIGCQDEKFHEGGQGPELVGMRPPGPVQRGVYLVGFRLDAKTADGSPVRLQVKDGALSAPAGVDLTSLFLGAIVTCPGKGKDVELPVRISAVRSDPKYANDPTIQQYSVHWDSSIGLKTCVVGDNWAVPTPGLWMAGFGAHKDDPALFTFACEGAAVAKCYDEWDYRPWKGTNTAEVQLRTQLHAACTRAVRADYCGDGHAFTKPGTTVDIWDAKYVAQSTTLPPSYTFESAWTDSGPLCKNHVRWSSLTDTDAGPNACVNALKDCADTAAANKLSADTHNTKPLIFVRSCGPDPCKCQPCDSRGNPKPQP